MIRLNKLDRQGQISIELLMLISILMIIFLGVIVLSNSYGRTQTSMSTNLYAKSLARTVAYEINNVFIAGSGSSKSILLPSTLMDNTPYNISVYPQAHIIDLRYNVAGDSKHISLPILTSNISGNLVNLQNTIQINNSNGGININ